MVNLKMKSVILLTMRKLTLVSISLVMLSSGRQCPIDLPFSHVMKKVSRLCTRIFLSAGPFCSSFGKLIGCHGCLKIGLLHPNITLTPTQHIG